MRDDRFLCGTQAHTNTLACTVQIHTWLRLYTHGGCVVMRLLHGNYTLKRRVYVHGRALSSGGGLLRHRSRGSFTVAGKSQRRKAGSISESPGALPPLPVQIQLPEQGAKRQRRLAARLIMILMVNRSSSREETTSDSIPNQTVSTETNGTK